MAIARVQVKVGGAGKAADHDSYISREEKYRSRLAKGEALEATESGNMPAWAASDPRQFWRAADLNERANGTTYREHELALPRELTPDQRKALVRDWVAQELGDKHAYRWAIHRPKAADGQDQPHAHLMFSERQVDGIERDPARYFKRYNAKQPERGGARKGYGPNAGKTLTAAERAAELRDLRARWGNLVNDHLERAGQSERIDMRSYADRGIDRTPEPKQLPSAWRDPAQRGTIIEFRKANKERDQARALLSAAVPDPAAALKSAERELKHQHRMTEALAEYDRNQAAKLQAPKAEQVNARQEQHRRDIAAILEQRQTPAPTAVNDHQKAPTVPAQTPGRPGRRNYGTIPHQAPEAPADRDPEQVYADRLKPIKAQQQEAAANVIEALRKERQQWTQAHRDHQENEPTIGLFGRQAKWERAGVALAQTGRDLAQREGAAAKAADPKAIERAAVAELRRTDPGVVQAAEAARNKREDLERDRKQREQEAKAEKAANEQVGKDFDLLARRRESGGFGFWDHSEDWKATPSDLKDRIAEYIKLPKEQRAADLEKINRDPKTREALRGLMAERETAIRKLSRGR